MKTKIILSSGTEYIVLETIDQIVELEALNTPYVLHIDGDGSVRVTNGQIVSLQEVTMV